MEAKHSISEARREYGKWVRDQTLEDFALRFTAKRGRKLSIAAVGKTALGATAFLALEALSAAATLQYGFINALFAMLAVAAAIVLTGLPIAYHAARSGLDIDLLTRGAGFGYLGSTITSLVYASFTFLFFAIEAAILASALNVLFHIPLSIGYVICALVVIPIVTNGIATISRFQIGTQPFWLALQILALGLVAYFEADNISDWVSYTPANQPSGLEFDLALFGACSAIFFAFIAQIGEQVDYLRFMPDKTKDNKNRWWFWTLLSGPGWISIGLIKMLFGSFLAYLAVTQMIPFERATDPIYMYQLTFTHLTQSPATALMLAGVMVLLSQMKINVTNAYAGSIAWSNFFSRLTHSHPGRVVWLVFNVLIALTLMELGVYQALEAIIGIFALVAISWLGSLSADLLINRPLGLSPQRIEFKRSHLCDINPVGFGSMLISTGLGVAAYMGYLGDSAKHLSHYVSLGSCYLLVPTIAWLTKGKYYFAREQEVHSSASASPSQTDICRVCEDEFEREDTSHCPAYGGTICSLCCSLDARCLDMCKNQARFGSRINHWLNTRSSGLLPRMIKSPVFRFVRLFTGIMLINATLLGLVYLNYEPLVTADKALLSATMWTLFYVLSIVFSVLCWLVLLAYESRKTAQLESNQQALLLMEEIDAHKETDATLLSAKEAAEHANDAKSRYLSGISHELRTPLQSVLGYAQLLQQKDDMSEHHQRMVGIIRNSGEHLANLIEGLLEISKIEAGRLEIFHTEVNIREVLNQLVQIFQPQAEAKGIEFHFHIHHTLPYRVKTDEKRLKQILINLLSNAIKYTESGRVDFHVYYRNQVAEFHVEDTGVGIAAKDLERLLLPFERVRNAHLPNVPGTGLGLTIVKLLTDIMGGELNIESEPDHGSRFSVSLMLSWVSTPEIEAPAEKKILGFSGRPRSILVVDDQATHRGLVSELLTPLGFTVVQARNADECLSMLDGTTPDAILLDVSMEGLDGLDLAGKLRHLGHQNPILMLSADATELHKKKDGPRAYDAYLAKPIRNRELVERLGELLNLEWHFSDTRSTTQDVEETLVEFKPSKHLEDLRMAASVGHKRGVITAIESLEAQSEIPAAAGAYLRKLAHSMRFDKIEALSKDAGAS